VLHLSIAAEKLFSFFGFPITNTLLMSWIVVGILILAAQLIGQGIKIVPGSFQNVFELFVEKFLGIMEGVLGSRKNAEHYFPLVGTIFIFILTSNWLGIFPGVGSVGLYEEVYGKQLFVPLFRSAASDLNLTLALGVLAVFLINVSGVAAVGVRAHLGKFFSFKGPLSFFVGILEFISEFAKIISFSFRLFGNIFAGEVLLIIVSFLAPFGAPLPFLFLEIFVGFVQALVFAMLTMVFISIAVAHHGEEVAHHETPAH